MGNPAPLHTLTPTPLLGRERERNREQPRGWRSGRGERSAPAEGVQELGHDVGADDGLELLPDDARGPREGLPIRW